MLARGKNISQKIVALAKKQLKTYASDQFVNVLFTITRVTTFDEVENLLVGPSTSGVGELERPEEVGDGLEVGSDGEDFVD